MKRGIKTLIEVSARHAHLSQSDIDKLFGRGYKIKFFKKLSQHSDFAAKETITIMNKGRKIHNVRVIGPIRNKKSIEISRTDAYFLKINPKIKIYSDKKDPLLTAVGTKGRVNIPAIIKQRHIHMPDKEARKLGLRDGNNVKVRVRGKRALVFENVLVRTDPLYRLSMHIDTDEGNAAGINIKTTGEIVK